MRLIVGGNNFRVHNERTYFRRIPASLDATLSATQAEYNAKSGSVDAKLEGLFSLCRMLALEMPFRCAQLWKVRLTAITIYKFRRNGGNIRRPSNRILT